MPFLKDLSPVEEMAPTVGVLFRRSMKTSNG